MSLDLNSRWDYSLISHFLNNYHTRISHFRQTFFKTFPQYISLKYFPFLSSCQIYHISYKFKCSFPTFHQFPPIWGTTTTIVIIDNNVSFKLSWEQLEDIPLLISGEVIHGFHGFTLPVYHTSEGTLDLEHTEGFTISGSTLYIKWSQLVILQAGVSYWHLKVVSQPNVPHVYYMCITHVIHVWCY